MPYAYTVHQPPVGPIAWLPQADVLNSKWFKPGVDPKTIDGAVSRWSSVNAQIAERIVRREWERRFGAEMVNTLAIPAIRRLVQAAAIEQCGVWNATTDGTWNWPAWAAFARWTASLNQSQFEELLGDIAANRCARYIPVLMNTVLPAAEEWVLSDPWYQGAYVWQLPEHGPYAYDRGPTGLPVAWSAPPQGMPPTAGVTPQAPPVEPAGPPVEPTGSEEKKRASGTQIALASVIGLAGVGFLVAAVKAKPAPKGPSAESACVRMPKA